MQKDNNGNNISKNSINSTSELLSNIYNNNVEDDIKVGTLLKSVDSGVLLY